MHDSSRQEKSEDKKLNINILDDEKGSGENSSNQYSK